MLEIGSDDCGTNTFLEVLVSSQKHAQTLVGKYFQDPHEFSTEWKVLDTETSIKYINRKIKIRSVMTCIEPNFKICKKCFGTKELPTKYVGITAGQALAER